jgi:hypothetical protein
VKFWLVVVALMVAEVCLIGAMVGWGGRSDDQVRRDLEQRAARVCAREGWALGTPVHDRCMMIRVDRWLTRVK